MLIGFLKILDVYDEYQKVTTLYLAMDLISQPIVEAYGPQRLPYTAFSNNK